MARILKNDLVMVITGGNKGKTGIVLEVLPEQGKILVKDVNIRTHHVKARRQGEVGGIKKREAYLDISNVMLVSPIDNKPCRVNTKILENGKKVRVSNNSKEII